MEAAVTPIGETIEKLTSQAPNIPEWVLTSFNDPDVNLVKKTNDVTDLKSGLFGLNFGGGGDIPEQAFKGTIHYRLRRFVGFSVNMI